MPLHAIIITHTDRLLEPVLLSAATQSIDVGEIVIGVDGDGPAVAAVVQRASDQTGRDFQLVTRPHQGEARAGQTRNNAARALLQSNRVSKADRVVVLDGDTIPAHNCFAAHARIGGRRHTVLALRYMLDESQGVDQQAVLAGQPPCHVSNEQQRTLRRLSRRWRKSVLLATTSARSSYWFSRSTIS